jgi:hypothetical protein
MVWVVYYVLPVVVGLGVLALCAYRLIAQSLVLKREVTAAARRLTAAGEALSAELDGLRPADGDGARRSIAARDDADGAALTGPATTPPGAAGVRGR